MAKKDKTDPKQFWRDYEAALGEKVLSYALGQYLSGWAEYDPPLWGLLIATDRGFRFHHFPHEGWLEALSRLGGGKEPEEKTIFIPRERILRAELRRERSLLKRIIFSSRPRFVIRYLDDGGAEEEFIAEADSTAAAIAQNLQPGQEGLAASFPTGG